MQQQQEKYKKKNRELSSMGNNYGKVPPQAIELETSILGAITLEKGAFDTVAGILKPECFYKDANQRIFKSMQSLARKNMPIDLLTLVQELKSSEELELVGGPYAITLLQNGIVSAANIETHAKVVYQKFHLRELIRISAEINNLAYYDDTDNFELQDYAERCINEIGMINIDGGMIPIERVMMNTVAKIEEFRNIGTGITGVISGFPRLDAVTRGWQPGDLIILAARPSVGKTAFALNLIKNAAKSGVAVGVWSLEMEAIYLGLRMVAAESGIFLHKLQTGKVSESEMELLYNKAIAKLSDLKIFFEENSNVTLQSLTRKARRLKKKENVGLLVIDYLQLMSGDDNKGNREQEVAKISRGLKNLAKELKIPIIALSQLSREMGVKNVTWEYGPPIAAIRESGAIEQDADLIMMQWGPSDDDIAKDPSLIGKRKVRIAKHRNGVLVTEEMNFRDEIQLFEAIQNTSGLPSNWTTVKSVNSYYEPKPKDEEDPF